MHRCGLEPPALNDTCGSSDWHSILQPAPQVELHIVGCEIAQIPVLESLLKMRAAPQISFVGPVRANRRLRVILQEKLHPISKSKMLSFPDDVQDPIVPCLKALSEGTVKFSGSVADLADETRHAELPWISIPTRHYQPRRLAVSPLRCELSRCRRSPGPTRHYGVLRSDPAVVPHVRFSIRSPAQSSTGPAGRHLAPGRGLRHHPGTAALSLACRRPRW